MGVLDLAFAMLFWYGRVPPIRILQSIAAGLLGRKESVAGGLGTAVLGGALHFAIATAMAFTYALVARRWPVLIRRASVLGAGYGLLLYAVMNFVVLPLSAVGMPAFTNHAWVASGIAVHVVFGVIFAHAARLALR